MAKQEQQDQVFRREGSRWINRPPEPQELAQWFAENVKLAAGLDHADYVAGITLIPAKEKVKRVALGANGDPQIVDVEQLVFTPYPKVETRELYFWDYCEHHGYLGEIELVPTAEPNKHLPDGFFHMPVTGGDGRTVTPFVGVSYRVHIWRDQRKTSRLRIPPAATKIVPLLRRGYSGTMVADENAVLKAQTGAIGRALGYAGMLVVPGAGIATAEDMLEYLGAGSDLAALPAIEGPVEAENGNNAAANLAELIAGQIERLQSEFPKAYEEARAWAIEKNFVLEEPPPDAMRSLERLLRRKLEQAEREAPSV